MLTDREIRAALKAATTEATLTDGAAGRGTGALRLVIRPTARGVSALWFAAWKRDGKRHKLALGRYPDLSLQDARTKFADAVRPAITAGRNPRAAAPRAERPTVERLLQAYVENMRGAGRRSADEVERALLTGANAAADALGRDRLAAEIDPGDIAAVLADIAERGAIVQADRTRAYLSAAWNWGIKAANDYRAKARQDWGIRTNPVAAVPRDTSALRARDRALTAGEIRAVWLAVGGPGFSAETRLAVRLLIACGQRVRETLRAQGQDFDLEAGTWRLPATTTKGGKPHQVPLPALAIAELRGAPRRGPLFPGRNDDDELMLDTSVAHALRRWAKTAKVAPFQTRDLRRTWKSRAADAGVDRFTRDLIQQHAQAQDTGSRVYDHADYMPQMRQAMLRWNAWLSRVIQSEPVQVLRPLRG
jgi:integrase